MWPYDLPGDQPEAEQGGGLFSLGGAARIKPPRIFAQGPNYGDTRGIPASMMPPSPTLDIAALRYDAPRMQVTMPTPMSTREAWERRFGVAMEQKPAPVEDAKPTPVYHFDP